MGSQAAQSRCTVVRPMQKSIGKWEIRPPVKLCIRDYVGEMTHHANFGFNRCSGGFSPNRQMLPPCDFFWLSCPYLFSWSCAQVEPLDRFSHFMAQTMFFLPRMVLLGVRMMGDHIWGNMPPKPPKWAWIGNFKPKLQNIKIAISPKL